MVDIFRASQYALPIVREALALNPRPRVIWMQLGVRDDEAARLAEANGLKVVMNRCPEDRIRPPVIGNRLDGREHADADRQEGQAR